MSERERPRVEGSILFQSIKAESMTDELFAKCAKCIRAWYPEGRGEQIASEVLDGFDVVIATESKNGKKIIRGLGTFQLAKDNKKNPYVVIGVAVVDPEHRQEGYARQLLDKIIEIGVYNGCVYMTALADTEDGQAFLEASDFYLTTDSVLNREYYRLDL